MSVPHLRSTKGPRASPEWPEQRRAREQHEQEHEQEHEQQHEQQQQHPHRSQLGLAVAQAAAARRQPCVALHLRMRSLEDRMMTWETRV